MRNSNEKGQTWMRRVRALSKDGWNEKLESRERAMTLDDWKVFGERVGIALEVVRLKTPRAWEWAVGQFFQYSAESNRSALVVLGDGVIALASVLARTAGQEARAEGVAA